MKKTEEGNTRQRAMNMTTATAIGVGAMIGAGMFALVGIAVEIAGTFAYISFLLAGFIALVTSYSTAKLASTFPKKGGRVTFMNRAFGKGVKAGTLNLMTCLGYIIVTSLYARAFGEYSLALLGMEQNTLLLHLISSGIVLLFVMINFIGAGAVGKAGLLTAAVKTGVLLLFGVAGLTEIEPDRLVMFEEFNLASVILASGVIFMSYEGFGLVANTAEDLEKPKKNLPRALFLSVSIVILIYILVNIAVIGNLSVDKIIEAKEHVLADAARPIFGSLGFTIMGLAALFSTSSAINSTIYGPVYMIQETSEAGELPAVFRKSLWGNDSGYALISIGLLILALTNLLNLEAIAETGSLIFLLVYTAVNYSNFKLYKETGSKRWIIIIGILTTAFAFFSLLYFLSTSAESLLSIYVFLAITVVSLLFEWLYMRRR